MIYLQKFVLFIAILFMISFSKSERINSSETTEKSDFLNETSYEDNDDSVEEESDDDYTAEFDTNHSNDINLGFNKLFQKISSNEEISVKAEKKNYTINDTLNYLLSSQDFFSNSVEKLYKKALPFLLRSTYEFELSEQCSTSLFKVINGIRSQNIWAMKFIDASAKFPSGLLEGTIADFGEYEECLNIKVTESGPLIMRGKYCMALISKPIPPKPENLTFYKPVLDVSQTQLKDTIWELMAQNINLLYINKGFRAGFCIPSTCSVEEIQTIADRILEPTLDLKFIISNCETKDEKIPFTKHQIISISILTTLLCISIITTLIDITNKKLIQSKQNKSSKLSLFLEMILSFSLKRNTQKLLLSDTYTKRLSVIHGIRVLAITWILIGHVYLMEVFQISYSFKRTIGHMPRLTWLRYQPLKLGGFIQVDTFFLIGGLVVSYVSLELLKTNGRPFNYFVFILMRLLRFTPNLIGVILIYFLMPHFGSGPIFKENIDTVYKPCEQFWWRNFLYINNFYDDSGTCANHTWYLAADFHLYLFSPIIFLLLKRSQLFGTIGNIFIIIGSFFISLIPPLISDKLSPSMYSLNAILHENTVFDNFIHFHWATYQHIAPYYIGIFIGYLIHKYNNIKIQKLTEISLWIICLSSGILTIFWTTSWMDPEAKTESPDRVQRLTFTALHKTTWVILPAWIIFINAMGRPGIIGKILSWKGFVPLSRLTYGIYLVHMVPIILRSYSIQYVMPFDDFYNISSACLFFLISVILSYMLYVLFEGPFANLTKLLIEKHENIPIETQTKL